jgi:PAS domain S-box-containing protein
MKNFSLNEWSFPNINSSVAEPKPTALVPVAARQVPPPCREEASGNVTLLRLQSVALETAANAVLITDAAGTILWVNPAFTRLTGYTAEEAVGRTPRLLKSGRHEARFYLEFWGTLRSGRVWRGEFTNRHKDGGLYYDQLTVTPVVGASGEVTHFVGVMNDITQQRAVEEELRCLNARLERTVRDRTAELEAANHELEAFCSSVSHDLRAPLRRIGAWSEVLLGEHTGQLDLPGQQQVQRICSETQRMNQLIEGLLGLSRMSGLEMKREAVNLSALARSIAAELCRQDPDRRAEFVIAEGLEAAGDPTLLHSALRNLLDNAWKFTARRPTAHIEFGALDSPGPGEPSPSAPGDGRPRHRHRAFFVRDDGEGFDPRYKGKLFGAFQRLHTVAEFPGLGIGLTTVQRIVHRHGGQVWADGEVGKGATFYFSLPPSGEERRYDPA